MAGTSHSSERAWPVPIHYKWDRSLSGSQDDSDSDMAFSVNQSSSASESSLGKEGQTFRDGGVEGAGRQGLALVAVPALPGAK